MKNNIDFDHRTPPYSYDEEKERVTELVYDKRIKHIKHCDQCGASMSRNRYKFLQGLCDNCVAAIN